MKISISAIPKLSFGGSQICLPIVIYLESHEEDKFLSSEWSPSVFPFQDSKKWNGSKTMIEQHIENVQELLSSKKEIGYYYPEDCSLSLDRELFSHYLITGCKISNALQRLLKNTKFNLIGIEKFKLDTLIVGGDGNPFEIKNSASILELSEKLKISNKKR